jgi:hypothetical protein
LCWWHGAREDRIERDFGFLLVAVLACFDQFLSLQSRCIDEEDVLRSGCRIEEGERHSCIRDFLFVEWDKIPLADSHFKRRGPAIHGT